MLAGDGVASRQNLRLHCARHVHKIDAAAAGICGLGICFCRRLISAPRAEHFFDVLQHFLRLEIANQQEQRVLRRVKFAVDGLQILALVRRDLRFAR